MKHIKAFAFYLAMGLVVGLATLMAASPTLVNLTGRPILPSGTSPYGGPFEFNWQGVPTSLTDVTTTTAHIVSYCFYNSTGGALTLTIQTKDGSPLPLPLSGTLASATTACLVLDGLRSNGGFSVQASGSGIYYWAKFTNA